MQLIIDFSDPTIVDSYCIGTGNPISQANFKQGILNHINIMVKFGNLQSQTSPVVTAVLK